MSGVKRQDTEDDVRFRRALAGALRRYQDKHNTTGEEMAKMIAVDAGSFSKYLDAKQRLRADVLARMLIAFDIQIEHRGRTILALKPGDVPEREQLTLDFEQEVPVSRMRVAMERGEDTSVHLNIGLAG